MTIATKVVGNPGTGGSSFAFVTDTNGADWSFGIPAFLAYGSPTGGTAVVQGVDAGHGLPVDGGAHGLSLPQLAREGRYPYTNGGGSAGFSTDTHPTVTANTSINVPSNLGPVPLGRAWVIVSASVGADGPCQAYFSDSGSAFTLQSGQQAEYTGDAFSLVDFIGAQGGNAQWRFGGGLILGEGERIQIGIVNPTTTGVWFSGHADIVDITNDLHFGARYKILVVGDSTSWTMPGTNGVTANTSNPTASGRDLDCMRITERLRAKGASVRLINKAYGSAQSASALIRALTEGWLDVFADLYIFNLGMNDAAAGAGLAYYQSNIASLITRAQYINPNCSIIVCGPCATNDPNRQYANIVAASSVGTAATASTVTLPSSAGVSAGNLVWVVASLTNSGQYATLGTNISGNQWNLVGGWPLGTPTGTLTLSVWNQNTSPTYIAQIRTKASAAAAAGGTATSDVVYLDQTTAYGPDNNNTQLTTYCGDLAPSVHSNQAGHGLRGNVLATAIAGTNFYLKTLGLTGTF